MKSLHNINLRRIDFVDKKLILFSMFERDKLNRKFTITKNNIEFQLKIGTSTDSKESYSYADFTFDIDLDTNLSVFEKEIPPIVNTRHAIVYSKEHDDLENRKNEERERVEEQLKALFTLILDVFNTFRRACKIALYQDSVAGRILVQNIQAAHKYLGVNDSQSLRDYFDSNDTEFLFGAFADLNLTSFIGDADIKYVVRNSSGQTISGVFKNGYKGLHSVNRFSEKFEVIQEFINDGWTVNKEVLLSSLEFLYAENYRMAVFNVATILEVTVVHFWEKKKQELSSGSREEQEKVALLNRAMQKSNFPGKKVEKILRVVLPEFIEQRLISDGTLERCVETWNIRNEKLAHVYEAIKEGKTTEVTSSEAWNSVASVSALIESLDKL